MEENLEQVFTLVEATPGQVVLKVLVNDPLAVAKFPFVSMDMAYITITRGKNHTLTVVKKDGKTWSFNWGENGYTLISDNTERLKKAAVEYIEDYMHILLEAGDWRVTEATIFYNKYLKKWQLTLSGKNHNGYHDAHWWSKTAESYEEMAAEVIPYIHARGWEEDVAQTGIRIWRAILD